VSIERRGDAKVHAGMRGGGSGGELRQIALEMGSKSEEVGDHDESAKAESGETGDSAIEVGRPEFEKRRLHMREAGGAGKLRGNRADCLVRRFDARAVCKNDEAAIRHRPLV